MFAAFDYLKVIIGADDSSFKMGQRRRKVWIYQIICYMTIHIFASPIRLPPNGNKMQLYQIIYLPPVKCLNIICLETRVIIAHADAVVRLQLTSLIA
jgi:hypothetical protein